MLTPYALRSPLRAAAVGTVSSREPPTGAARALVVAEEEQRFFDDLPADRSAELVLRRFRQELPVSGSRWNCVNGLRAWNLSLWKNSKALPCSSLRARLRLHRHHARGRLAELGVVVLRGDLRLANRLEGRVDDDDAEDRIAVLGAVELIARAAEMLAVDHRLHRALRVLARRVLPAELLRAGRQQDELREVAIEHRQVGHLLRVECRRDVGAVGLEQRRTAGHLDRFGDRAELRA